jgi:hypothetical protein
MELDMTVPDMPPPPELSGQPGDRSLELGSVNDTALYVFGDVITRADELGWDRLCEAAREILDMSPEYRRGFSDALTYVKNFTKWEWHDQP